MRANYLMFSSRSGPSCEFLKRLLESHSAGNRDVFGIDYLRLEFTTKSMGVNLHRITFWHLILISPFD